ncbi:hypothetical protein ACHAWU_002883 [Discostella pseudostelligera]|uniref:Helicase ATP-binding domain-containing protein n=1 Tax=Discostella pseudostelligera TaxID=259834 RepID=A0ABD3LZ43_9STRA
MNSNEVPVIHQASNYQTPEDGKGPEALPPLQDATFQLNSVGMGALVHAAAAGHAEQNVAVKRPGEPLEDAESAAKKQKTVWEGLLTEVRGQLRAMNSDECFSRALELQMLARSEVGSRSQHLSNAMDLMANGQAGATAAGQVAMNVKPGAVKKTDPAVLSPAAASQRVTKAEREVSKQKPIKTTKAAPVPCMKMTPPLPPRCEVDNAPNIELPAFCQLVNFPTARYYGNCVMCDEAEFPIPKQNKGVCNNCDVAIWVVNPSGMNIKWCKGCKNFRKWVDFGVKTCTYININDRAIRCHACDVHRPNGAAAAPAIVDLTEICSPKLAATADDDQSQAARRRRGDIMESNRSRRRRRLEQSTSISEAHVESDAMCGRNKVVENIPRSKGDRDSDDDCIIVDPAPRMPSVAGDNYPKIKSKMKSTAQEESKPKKSVEIRDKSEHKVERKQLDGTKRQHHHTSEQNSSNQRLTDLYTRSTPTAEALLERANIILQQSFKHNSLRPLQETAVVNTLQRKSSIVVMATGGGKSLVYQLPALVGGSTNTKICADTSKVTIVVCPLIALMMDQVNNLLKRGIHTAACFSSSHNAKTRQEILNRLQLDKKRAQKGADKSKSPSKVTPIQLLYCTPELIETDRFRDILTDLYESNRLYLFAIDEAHCTSTWDSLNATKPQGAILDLVAVVKEQHDIERKNNRPCSGIVYVHKREDCQSLAMMISKDHSLVELEGMVNYCIKPMCKRKYVLGHFGENIDANIVCNKTCDYCMDPAKVERNIQASECMSTVIDSHQLIHAGRKEHQYGEKKFHHNPLDDGESLEDDDRSYDDFLGYDEELLGVTDNAGQNEMIPQPTRKIQGFAKASSMLSKYAKMECQEGKKDGFVNFKTRKLGESTQEDNDGKKYRAVNIPNHLRVGMPDPLAAHNKTWSSKDEASKTSSSHVSESERLQAELAELQKQKAAALAKLGGPLKGSTSRQLLHAPTLSFKKQR